MLYRYEQRFNIYIYIYIYKHIYFCSLPGTDWPKIKHSRVPKRFVLISCVFMTICDYKAFPKDLGMGVGVGNVVIGVWGRNMTSAQ
jgi:hypothetical protein